MIQVNLNSFLRFIYSFEIFFMNTFLMKPINFILYSLTSQWLNQQSMNAYQTCPSRNTFGYGTQIPSSVQSINSFPSLSNNIGKFWVLIFFEFKTSKIQNKSDKITQNSNFNILIQLFVNSVSGSTSPNARLLEYPYSYDSARKFATNWPVVEQSVVQY